MRRGRTSSFDTIAGAVLFGAAVFMILGFALSLTRPTALSDGIRILVLVLALGQMALSFALFAGVTIARPIGIGYLLLASIPPMLGGVYIVVVPYVVALGSLVVAIVRG